MSQNHYQILDIDKGATPEEIKKAYRKKAMEWHPDKHKGDKSAEAKFKEINEAYSVLSDPQKKQMYDQFGEVPNNYGSSGFGGFQSSDFDDLGDIFSQFFGSGFSRGGGRKRNFDNKGEDLQTVIDIDFLDAALGAEHQIEIEHMVSCDTCKGKGSTKPENKKDCTICHGSGVEKVAQQSIFGQIITERTCHGCRGVGSIIENPCTNCQGAGRINKREKIKFKIPAGVETKDYVILKDYGNAGIMGGNKGDLYVVFRVKDHPIFKKHHLHIISNLEIDILQAILGDTIEVDTIHGKNEITIPQGSQYQDEIKLKGEGIHNQKGSKGDHIFILDIKIPTKLSKEEKDKYTELVKIRKNKKEGFFSNFFK